MTVKHFENLWEDAENFHKENGGSNFASILDELSLKINLYKGISLKEDLLDEDRKKLKSLTYGEILLTLTQLSLIDDINTFEALSLALKYRAIEHLEVKYKD